MINNSPSKINLIPIILSGGVGSRLWPLSRANFPKQYIQISLFPDDETKDEFWIGDKNLYAITRYNPSSKYAMSVFLLSEELKITSDL